MFTRPSTLSPSKHPLFYGLILCLLISYSTASYYEEFYEDRPMQEYKIEPNSENFKIDLDYPEAFQVNITAFNGSETEASFCKTYPSRIVSQVEWNGPISVTSGSYDNIEFYKDYYFILESLSFNIIAIQDFADSPSNIIIESEFQNEDKDKTFFVLDPEDGFLFVMTRKHLFSYSLNDFFNAVKENKAIPKLKYEAPNFRGYETILSIRYYKHRLYIVADNIVEVFVINNQGEVTPQIKFDAEFFQESGQFSVTDIALKDNYAYVLDKINGIYVVDVSNADLPDHTNVTDKYKFQPNDTESLPQGQFIEVIGDSLQVISDSNELFEFIIREDPLLGKLVLNRRFKLSHFVQATFADSNFLYLLNASSNMVAKHSIPGSYKTKDVEDSLVAYWSLLGTKGLVSKTVNQTSRVAVLYEDSVSIIVFKESNPYISCNNTGMLKGLYSYKLQAVQKDCPAKINAAANNTEIDYHTVCIINQELRLSITQDSISLLESKQTNFSLYIGVAVVTLIIILSICLLIKYKNQKNRLFKFRQFENENTDQNVASKDIKDIKSVASSNQEEIDPYSINIMAELKKYEEQHSPKAELEDIKPLDIEGIYGRTSKVNQNDDDSSI